jgi:ssDNA-binding Zn-finger/Zn-ribbon topoisomerase 1
MINKLAKHGTNAGNYFYGCRKFPECRGSVSIPEKDQKWISDIEEGLRESEMYDSEWKIEQSEFAEEYGSWYMTEGGYYTDDPRDDAIDW